MSKFELIMALPSESNGEFEKAGIPVNYSGIGKINATLLAMELILSKKAKAILNLGTAGSHKFPVHSLVEATSFVQRDMDLSPLGFPLGETPMDSISGRISVPRRLLSLTEGVCGTADVFEVGPPKLECDMVDMESYALAKVCKKMKVNFCSIKYISDGSNQTAHTDWRNHLKPASQALLEVYEIAKTVL